MATETPRNGVGRGVKWALGLSLALNLIFVGLMVGASFRFAGPEGPKRFRAPEGVSYGAPFVRALPWDARRALHRSLRQEAGGLPSRAERRALYARMIELLRADPFDRAAVEAIFADQASTAQAIQTRAQAGWLGIVSEMSAAERAAVAEGLEDAMSRRKKRRRSWE